MKKEILELYQDYKYELSKHNFDKTAIAKDSSFELFMYFLEYGTMSNFKEPYKKEIYENNK